MHLSAEVVHLSDHAETIKREKSHAITKSHDTAYAFDTPHAGFTVQYCT